MYTYVVVFTYRETVPNELLHLITYIVLIIDIVLTYLDIRQNSDKTQDKHCVRRMC